MSVQGGSSLPFSYPDLVLWLDASLSVPQGPTVLTYPDKSSQHNDMSLTSTSYSYRGQVGGFKNGTEPGFALSASSSMTFTNTITFSNTPVFQTFFACILPSAAGTLHGSGNFGLATNLSLNIQLLDSGGSHSCNGATDLTPLLGTIITIAGVINSNNAAVYLNGVQDGTSAVFGSITNTMAGIGNASTTMAGAIAEMMVFKSALGASDITNLHRYAKDRWMT